MLNNLGLRVKIFALVTVVVVVTFLAAIWVVSIKSMDLARKDAFHLAAEMADKYKNEIRAELQGARVTSETLAIVFSTLKDHGLTDRDMMNNILKNALVQKDYITAFCIAYAPDALDGRDAYYAGRGPEYDETGRYAPYWNKLDGSIDVQPLYDIDIADWWHVPRDTKQEYITDPYPYMVQGREVMLESLIFPILHKGEFIGIISSDIVLDKLQDMVSQADVHVRGGYTEIFSNSGVIVAHPDENSLAKDINEIFAYNMLMDNPSLAGKALKLAENYLRENSPNTEADEEQSRIYAGLKEFVALLRDYSENVGDAEPELKLLSPGMAGAILQADTKYSQDAAALKKAISNGEQYIANNPDYYTIYMPIRFSDATNPWSVAVSIPMAEVLKNADDIRNFLLLVALVAVCVIAALLFVVANNISRPVMELTKAAEKIGGGNFDIILPAVSGNNEIGILSGAFKSMAKQIDDLIHKLRDYARELKEKNAHLEQLNESLTTARDDAEKSNRSKSEFLSNISHEMRTPLNAIIGMISIGQTAVNTERKDYAFGKIRDASAHLLGVINDVLDMSKIEAGKLELSPMDFNFERMIRKVVDVISFRVEEKHLALYVTIDKKIPTRLLGDDQRLSQVLANLLSNAVKFTPEDGTIRLDIRLRGVENDTRILEFEVSDTGIGIGEDQQKRLFAAFQQADSSTSRRFGGSGLGLAISKRIIETMGGGIRIESTLGKGSTFIFTVRLACGKDDNTSLLNPGVNWHNIQVLTVDDDDEVLRFFEETAKEFGIRCDVAADGEEALKIVDRNQNFDIYFIDWKLPGMDGIELTRQIKGRTEGNSIVIMISSTAWSTIADEARAAGVDRYLAKPIFPSDIVDCINECLGVKVVTEEISEDITSVFKGRRVLLAEDVEINREIVLALLEPTELIIDCVENGVDAVRMFREKQGGYDMILMDIQMPEMDGFEATGLIRAMDMPHAKTVPIIAMTANVFKEDVEKCLTAGMNDHVGKPLDFDAVMEKLRKYLL